MSTELVNITVNSPDPSAIARWWAGALDATVSVDVGEYASVAAGAVGLSFQKSDDEPGNTMHFDLKAEDREAEVERFVALGAERIADREVPEFGLEWTVLADPDGNRFCVASGHDED
ncbi:VOC family protein [Salininema proteolyticum]|uniref:VOC family protein n=1 Tax=Salininema proteolyticum TaxID=1607685 RepID=A0ABV8TY06_9ACTN